MPPSDVPPQNADVVSPSGQGLQDRTGKSRIARAHHDTRAWGRRGERHAQDRHGYFPSGNVMMLDAMSVREGCVELQWLNGATAASALRWSSTTPLAHRAQHHDIAGGTST